MPDSSVRDIHDAVADSDDPVVASTRPATTTDLELRRMVADVIAKLQPDGVSVIEVGCGTGVLGIPVARRASRYAGVDISPRALDVLRQRVPTATVRCADVTADDLSDLGTYDRVLVYAALHYVQTADEGRRFIRNSLARLAPGGRALIGNIPLPAEELPHSAGQRLRGLAWSAGRRLLRNRGRAAPPGLPPGSCLPLTRSLIEEWLGDVAGVTWRWAAPATGVPLQRTRADLLLQRDGGAGRR